MIIIRHGKKQWSNGSGPHDDPPLMYEIAYHALAKSISKLPHIPKRLIISPYYRCQQTAEIICILLGKQIPIIIDPLLHEYHKHEPKLPRGSSIPKVAETKEELLQRANRIRSKYPHDWIITHRPVIKALTGKHIKQGGCLVI